jgi:hypothetical protein
MLGGFERIRARAAGPPDTAHTRVHRDSLTRYHPRVPEADTESVVLPEVALHLSARHFPVLVATWFGVPNPEIIARYSDWLDGMGARAEVEGTKLVILGDTTELEGRPGPEVRRAMANALERLQARHPGRVVGITTIIGQPMMRAVITMVLAITRQKVNLKPVKDVQQALARTFELLDEAAIPRPAGLDSTYRRPARPR